MTVCKRIGAQPIKKNEDIKKINKYLKDNNYKGYVLWQFGLHTGLRVGDILRLKIGDVYGRAHVAIIEQKTQKQKIIPIVPALRDIIEEYCKERKPNEFIFTNNTNNSKLNRTTAYRYIVNACKRAGITEHVGTHTMRKTFGYHHYQQFHDAVILQKIFNHSSLRITLRYIGVEQDEIESSYRNFSYDDYPNNTVKFDSVERALIDKFIDYVKKADLRELYRLEKAMQRTQIFGENEE